MRKTAKTHPFLVKAFLPKGAPLGSKTRETVRNSRFKTKDEAIVEKDCLLKIGATDVLVFNGKERIA